MATLLKTDGSRELNITLKSLNLKEIQEMVGGYMEIVRLPEGMNLIVNEEGRMLDLPMNRQASEHYGQAIVGDAILCHHTEMI
jgi:hypothetical protein